MSALDDAVRAASLADANASPRRSFTASARAGVLAMRRASAPWRFSVGLIRAGLCVAPRIVARARATTLDGQRVLGFDVRLEMDDWSWVELAGLLEASLHDVPADPPPLRWRSLIGGVVNGALATQPRWVELHTPVGARRWALDAGAAKGEDPYAVQRISTQVERGGFRLRIAHPAEGAAAIWARWTGRSGPPNEVARLWSWALGQAVDPESLAEGVAAARLDAEASTELSSFGRWWPAEHGGLFLRRDGVRIAELTEPVLRIGGVPLHGEVEAAAVALDADEQQVRIDAGLHALVAWLQCPTLEVPRTLLDVSGRAMRVDELRESDEVVFAWPHQHRTAEGTSVGTVNALTPPQLDWLQGHTDATLMPAKLALESRSLPRVDLTALHEGSIGPVGLGDVAGGRVEAYVHRYPVAQDGRIRVHGFGRVMFETLLPALPGVTVVGLLPPGLGELEDARVHAESVRERAMACSDLLTQAVLDAVDDAATRARVPWFAHRWSSLSPVDLELRFVAHGSGVRLAWRDDPLLVTNVATERDGSTRTARQALERLRDVGGIVIAEAGGRWHTLESSSPAWTPWTLSTLGAELLQRLVTEAALWRMPMVPEAQLRPQSLRGQAHVRLTGARVAELQDTLHAVGRAAEWARRALLAHLLWARANDEDELGLEGVPLLRAYDPRGANPWRRLSLEEAERERFEGLVPPGAEHRALAGPVLQASPAFAHGLVELGVVAVGVSPVRSRVDRPRPAPTTGRRIWLRQRVVSPVAVGALTVADEARGVEVWEEGLRTHTVALPHPFEGVSGRVWVHGKPSDAALVRVLGEAATQLVASARRALLLCAPGSARARALEDFVRALPTPSEPSPPPTPVSPVLGSDRLAATLRFALGRPVAVEASRVSWSLVRDDEGLERLRLGGLHPLVRAARDEGAGASAIGAAALTILFALHRDGRLARAGFDEGVARVLAALE